MKENFYKIIKEKDYLIKSVIKKLNIYRNFDEFYHIGTIALFNAYKKYDITKDQHNNFDVYAFYIILNQLKNELKRINKYQKIEMTIDLYQNEYLAPIIEDDLINKIEIEDLFRNLNDIQNKIIVFKKAGYTHKEISKFTGLSLEQIKYQIRLIINQVREILNQIKVN